MKKYVFFLLTVCSVAIRLVAQPLTLSIQVNPPYSANYSSYFQGPQQMVLSITNSTANTYSIFLAGSVATLDGSISVSTSASNPWPGAALVVPPGLHTYTGADLQPFAENTNAVYQGITMQDVQNGLLPEGDYQVCLRAYDYSTLQALSAGEPSGCSNVFTVAYPAPPILTAPACESSISRTMPQNILFSWLPPTGLTASVIPQYRFTLVVLNDGVDALTALSNPVDPVYQINIPTTTLNYGSAQPVLQSSRRYAWRVQAFDPSISPALNQSAAFQNEGYSIPCTFTYLEPGSSGNPFTLVFPLDGDTLPWDYMPIYHRFDPYSTNYISYSSDITIEKNGVSTDSYNRELSWPNGPELSQEQALSLNITQEQAQHINMYKPLTGVSPPAIKFMDGNTYTWDASIEIQSNNGNTLSGNLSGSFSSGMGKPRPTYPANNDTIKRGQSLGLRFQTAAPPQRLVPPYSIMQTTGSSGAQFFDGGLSERCLLEISTSPGFETIAASYSKKLGAGLDYLNGACIEQCLLDSLYRELTFSFNPTEVGWYYWRVRWLSDPNQTSGASYRDGPTWRFYSKDGGAASAPVDPVPPTPGECVSTCDAPEIDAADKIPVTTIINGDQVGVGLFTMNITEISWAGNAATGKGTIPVPYLKAPMKVKFSGIKINSAKKMYEGVVVGEYDNTVDGVINSLSSSVAGAIGSTVDLSSSQTQSVNNLLSGLAKDQWSQLNGFLQSAGRLVSQFTMSVPTGLPIGIDQTIDGQQIVIGVVGLKFTPTKASLTAMISLDLADMGGWLGLGATNICFHPDGIGGDGRAMLYLPKDHTIDFGDDTELRFNRTQFSSDFSSVSDSGTYVSWDCNGFKALNVDGKVVFGQNLLVEDLNDGSIGASTIEATFNCKVRRKGQWIAKLDFNHPFQIKGAQGWGFDVEEAWLDFSENLNPDGFVFPSGYNKAWFAPAAPITGGDNYWKGFYLKRQVFKLPPQFETYDDKRITANILNTLIDKEGVSTSVRVENILSTGMGDLGGWGFSIDTLKMDIVQNSFIEGGFRGKIRIPISDSALTYTSFVKQNTETKKFSYELAIVPKSSINADLWVGTLELYNTSHISAIIDETGAYAKAELSGKLSIDAKVGDLPRIQFELMGFEKMTFQTRAEYFVPGTVTFKFASPQKFIGSDETTADNYGSGGVSGFPLTISNINIDVIGSGTGVSIGPIFDVNLNLMGETEGFKATTRIAVLAKFSSGANGHDWEFDRIRLDSVGISGKVGVVELAGYLKFYEENPIYGNGIKGFIRATFEPKIQVEAIAQFGSKDGFRYWYVDAQAIWSPGMPLAPLPIAIYGFGGGAWYHMNRSMAKIPDVGAADKSGKSETGSTYTGVTFTPTSSTGMGFEARVILGDVASGNTFNGPLSLGAQFSDSWGFQKIWLDGDFVFMRDLTDKTTKPQVRAHANITYDNTVPKFDASLSVDINIAEGTVTGGGTSVLHFDPTTWYVYMGTPNDPIGLNFADLFNASSYFMVGNQIEAPNPPPTNCTSLFGGIYAPDQNLAACSSGSGFACGARMSFPFDKRFLIFRGILNFGAGFDASIVKYNDAYCQDNPGEPIGIDGWYAQLDNLYAYVNGKLSMHVDVWVYEGDYVIAELGAAFLLKAGLPNPTYLEGYCGGYYNILDGLVSGNYSFKFEIGKKCELIAENPLAKVQILSDLVPYNQEQNVDCRISPEAAFNLEADREFEITEPNPDGGGYRVRTFRCVIENFTLREEGKPTEVQTVRNYSEDRFKAKLSPGSLLSPQTWHLVSISIKAEELIGGTWQQAKKRDGTPIRASQTNRFKTGNYPDNLFGNVLYTYPINTQRFYLQGECKTAKIELKQQDAINLNPNPPSNPSVRREYYARIIPIEGGQEQTAPLNINNFKTLSFEMPDLANSKIYACQVISKEVENTSILDGIQRPIGISVITSGGTTNSLSGVAGQFANSSSAMGTYMGSSASSSGSVPLSSLVTNMSVQLDPWVAQSLYNVAGNSQTRNNRINAKSVRKGEKLLFLFYFKTSRFNTLSEKLASFDDGEAFRDFELSAGFGSFALRKTVVTSELTPGFNGIEEFDVFDVGGLKITNGAGYPPLFASKPLVSMREDRGDAWNTNYAMPYVYSVYNEILDEGCNLGGGIFPSCCSYQRLDRASPDTVGIPPIYTVKFSANNNTKRVLAPTEYLPYSSDRSSAVDSRFMFYMTTSFNNQINYFSTAPEMELSVTTALQTKKDYDRINTMISEMMWRCGNHNFYPFYSSAARTKMNDFLAKGTFELQPPGLYKVQFQFNKISPCTSGIRNIAFVPIRKSYNLR